MWELYDDLIGGIPVDPPVDEAEFCGHFSYLRAGDLFGVAFSVDGTCRPPMNIAQPAGRSLRDVAAGVKSWNYREATMGLAAINAYYNSKDNVTAIGLDAFTDAETPQEAREKHNPLSRPPEEIRGKKVAVIGHFPQVEKQLGGLCDLYILERRPQQGDYPDSACEYLLPEMDYVFSTGMTLINKTLPRLLQLKGPQTKFILVGPSGPLTPILFRYGVDCVAGFAVTDPAHVKRVLHGNLPGMFAGGKMVEYNR